MSFLSCVVRLILKKTSLLLSVTFMLRCSDWPSSGFCAGEPLSDILGVFVSGIRRSNESASLGRVGAGAEREVSRLWKAVELEGNAQESAV